MQILSPEHPLGLKNQKSADTLTLEKNSFVEYNNEKQLSASPKLRPVEVRRNAEIELACEDTKFDNRRNKSDKRMYESNTSPEP